jgi:hypothetical protein
VLWVFGVFVLVGYDGSTTGGKLRSNGRGIMAVGRDPMRGNVPDEPKRNNNCALTNLSKSEEEEKS